MEGTALVYEQNNSPCECVAEERVMDHWHWDETSSVEYAGIVVETSVKNSGAGLRSCHG